MRGTDRFICIYILFDHCRWVLTAAHCYDDLNEGVESKAREVNILFQLLRILMILFRFK